MADQTNPGQAAPENAAGEEPGKRLQKEDPQKKRKNSVFQYIAILFAAAFALLLFTYMMDRREAQETQQQNQEQIEDLNQQTMSAVQSLNDLYAQNDDLKAQVEELQQQLSEAGSRADAAESAAAETQTTLDQTKIAMDWFWQLDEAYVRGKKALAREILEKLAEDPAHPLYSYLPTESATDNDRFSPYDRYVEIRDALADN